MIKQAFFNSWKNLKQNPKLLIPDFVYRVVTIAVSFYLASYYAVISNIVNAEIPNFETFLNPDVVNALIFVGIFVLFEFLFGVAIESVRYGLINDLLRKNKCLLKKCGGYVKKYYVNILKMKLLVLLIYAVAAVIAFIPPVVLNLATVNVSRAASLASFGLTAGILYIFLSLAFVFRYPVLIMENKKAWTSIKASYEFMKNNFGYTLKVGIAMALISLIVLPLSALVQYAPWVSFVSMALDLILFVFLSLFLFNSYSIKKRL